MQHVNPKRPVEAGDTAVSKAREAEPIEGAVARIFVRPDASRHALQEMEKFLETSLVGDYATSEMGSSRLGIWHVIDVTDRRDLERIRTKTPYLIDGWMEFEDSV